MSDLTRYRMKVGDSAGGFSVQEVEDGRGWWVKAEEAEARIKELTQRNHEGGQAFMRSLQAAQDRIKELEAEVKTWHNAYLTANAQNKDLRARVWAADELADAVERYGKMFSQGNWMKAWNACLAYREAGK
jgi:N-methylhydantoinase B/oxoprolinase/acetone carboxylase alpha subunit